MEKYKIIKWLCISVFIVLILLTLILLLLDNKTTETILISIGSIVIAVKINLDIRMIGIQKNELIEEQKNNLILKNTVSTLETQNNELIKNQEIIEAKYIEIKNVENQIIYPNKLSSDDELMKDIRDNLSAAEADLRFDGLLNSFFNSNIFDDLCIFASTLDSSRYVFIDKDLNKILTQMKKDLIEFESLYYDNIVRKDKTYMAQLKYSYMSHWSWKYGYTEKDIEKAENDMKRINKLLTDIIINLEKLVKLYIDKRSPHQGKSI